ncbi:hypothetical protein E6P78_09500 [Streptomyces sp. A0958]|uniref:hypothetical protein n=1 Tax=Streptomyces sp. A0958 TaxID=2563101 RepID=UPI00109E4E48|nr:hypothetical protein [Streptomyces sp. A0958]THA70781.1 hypothetical protein E6P78_09500 [Streptomyces sp. A0958]
MVLTRKALLGVSAAAAMAATAVVMAPAAGGTATAVGAPVAGSPLPRAGSPADASSGGGSPAGASPADASPAVGGIAPEADVSHHGHVSLRDGGLGIWLRSENSGPSDLPGVTVRLRVSVPPADRQELPGACLRADPRTVLCRTGPLRADGSQQRRLALHLQLRGRPDEVVVRIDTAWNGGATDRNTKNSEHEVLAPATGDPYVF